MKVGRLTDLCGVVNDSATVNIAQLTGLENGSVFCHPHLRLEGVLLPVLQEGEGH